MVKASLGLLLSDRAVEGYLEVSKVWKVSSVWASSEMGTFAEKMGTGLS